MTTIRTTCPRCGAVEMGIDSVLLSVREESGDGSYRFSCPGCLDTVEKPADQKIVALLLSVGVDVQGLARLGFDDDDELGMAMEIEAEAQVREDRPVPMPPFTVDDLITFHFLLQDDDRLARALTSA